MSVKSDYNKEEWLLLYSLPAVVGLSVLMVDDSGMWGTTKESFAVSKEMAMGVKNYPYNSLIQNLLKDKTDPDGEPVKDALKDLQEQIKLKGIENFVEQAADDCGKAASLLAEKSDDKEAAGYKAWVMSVARKVAQAAKEKDSDGDKVSPKEQELLDKFSVALGV